MMAFFTNCGMTAASSLKFKRGRERERISSFNHISSPLCSWASSILSPNSCSASAEFRETAQILLALVNLNYRRCGICPAATRCHFSFREYRRGEKKGMYQHSISDPINKPHPLKQFYLCDPALCPSNLGDLQGSTQMPNTIKCNSW